MGRNEQGGDVEFFEFLTQPFLVVAQEYDVGLESLESAPCADNGVTGDDLEHRIEVLDGDYPFLEGAFGQPLLEGENNSGMSDHHNQFLAVFQRFQ